MAEEDKRSEAGDEKVKQGECAPQTIYIKDLSFETPHSPEILTEEWKP